MWQLTAAAPASAYEDQLTLGAGLGYAYASAGAQPHHGLDLQVEGSLGLDESWTVRALLTFGVHPGTSSVSRLNLGGELLYLFDLFEFVPYLGVGLDALGTIPLDGGVARGNIGVHPALGMDWLISREWLVGFCVRPIFVLNDWKREQLYFTALVNASWVLDL